MPRTTRDLVGMLVEIDEEFWPNLDPHILSANVIVTKKCVSDDDPLTEEHAELVERWLAAHFYAVSDPQSTYEQAGSVSIKFESKVDLGLNLTRFGQQAMVVDTTGGLAAWNAEIQNGRGGRLSARFQWLGTPKADEDLP